MSEYAKKITVIIPLHERKNFFLRLLSYYSGYGCRVIVADSSEDPLRDIPHWVKYIHSPGQLYYKKLRDALREVETDYVLEVADDDFVLKRSMDLCIKFLEENYSYVAVKGQMIKFDESTHELSHSYRHKRYLNDLINDFSGEPRRRLRYLFNNFWQLNHAVTRTEVFLEYCNTISSCEALQPIYYQEKIMGFIYALRGDYKVLPCLYMMRSNSRMIIADPELYRKLRSDVPLEEILNVLRNAEDNPLVQLYASVLNVPLHDAKMETLRIFRMVVNRSWFVDRVHKLKRIFLEKIYGTNMLPSKNWTYTVDIDEVMHIIRGHQ